MIHQVFSVYDSKSEEFSTPYFSKTLGMALRDFASACANPDSYLYKNPEDYTFFHLGSFDSDKAVFDIFSTPVSVGLAVEFVEA